MTNNWKRQRKRNKDRDHRLKQAAMTARMLGKTHNPFIQSLEIMIEERKESMFKRVEALLFCGEKK